MTLEYNPKVFRFSECDVHHLEELDKLYATKGANKTSDYADVMNKVISRRKTERTIPWGSLDGKTTKVTTTGQKIRHIHNKDLTTKVRNKDIATISPMLDQLYSKVNMKPSEPTKFYTDPRYIHPAAFYQQLIFGGQSACPAVYKAVGKMKSTSAHFEGIEMSQGMIDEIKSLFDDVTKAKFAYTSSRPNLKELHKQLTCMENKDFRTLETLLAFLSNDVYNHSGTHESVITLLEVIESCFNNAQTKYATPGMAIVAPPGTGKTLLQSMLGIGFLDTDHLSATQMDKNPAIVTRLLQAGFSLLSNRWEHKKWNHPFTYYVMPNDVKATLEYKNIHPKSSFESFLENLKQARKQFFKLKVGPRNKSPANDDHTNGKFRIIDGVLHVNKTCHYFDQEKWLAAFSNLPPGRTYVLGKGQTLVDGYNAILQDIINMN